MRKAYCILFLALMSILVPVLPPPVISGAQQKQTAHWRITVEQFVKGTYRVILCEATPERLLYRKFSTNTDPPRTMVDRRLSLTERKRLETFLAGLSLDRLFNSYSNNRVQGSIHFQVTIRYRNRKKQIHLYFRCPPEIMRLLSNINKLLPETLVLYIYTYD